MSGFGDKERLREAARGRRLAAHLESADEAALAVASHFTAALGGEFGVSPGAAVAGYWPIGDEFDLRPLMHALIGAGYACALPRMTAIDAPLDFHRWRPDDVLVAGRHGISEPDPKAAERVFPDVVIAPLLAFDAFGYRLGYGVGYYDRTIAQLRGAGNVLVVGAAFAAQEVDSVPHDDHDECLDWVVTEAGVMHIAAP
jgi:5-formyltetrahydrofolate cyclo-ligase